MSVASHHSEWLSLIEVSGPFLSLPVLMRALPQGVDARDAAEAAVLRSAYEEWLDNQQGLQPDTAMHRAWVEYVLTDLLEFDAETLRSAADDLSAWSVAVPEHGETLCPDFAIVNPPGGADAGQARLLIQMVPPEQGLDKPLPDRSWSASPAARMQELLHGVDVPLGVVTNGEQWMLAYAPRGETTGFASWYAQLWFDEPLTLRAWTTLLGVERFFAVPDEDTLAALLAESAKHQHEVTDQLGLQVRHAVELLVQAIDGADRDGHGALLEGVALTDLYEAAVTVMMRLVFLLSAEERKLLPIDDPFYAEFYAVSTLQGQLRAQADQTGEEVLEYRHDAWSRLLATFRAVHGGVHHDRWQMSAYGGGLFDPERFPFLEGRGTGDTGTQEGLPISNRTVLHLLEALQLLRVPVPGGGMQTRRLSFRGLDIEQIGHVYEGLLDHTAVRAETPVLGLKGTAEKEPEVALSALEAVADDEEKLLALLKNETGRSKSALRNGLAADPPESTQLQRLRSACNNDESLLQRVLPWHGLIREDSYGRPVVINGGSVYVTGGSERRATGTHYTPRSLTEPIVQHTLEPLVYVGPTQGKPREAWALRTPAELLDLKICDMAMGSGAFLVQANRYLSERLVEAWERAERLLREERGAPVRITPEGAATRDGDKALPALPEERLLLARRLVADRSLYGVDKNPLAVEMAKLSLWLITLDRGKPFTFLDHALKCGDSLVGIHSLEQLRCWNLEGSGERHFSTVGLDVDMEKMVRLRREIEEMPVRDIRDQQAKAFKLAQAEALAHDLKTSADMLIASYYNTLSKRDQSTLRKALLAAARDGESVDEQWSEHADLVDPSSGSDAPLQPFHWPLEFPEVFLGVESAQQRAESVGMLTAEGTLFGAENGRPPRSGFDAFVGNPPFIGGRRIRSTLGDEYRTYIDLAWPDSSGNADYCAFFFLQGFRLLQPTGALGLIATNTIAQGDTRETGLAKIEEMGGTIYRASNDTPWPGNAAVVVDVVHIARQKVEPPFVLDGQGVQYISSQLDNRKVLGEPYKLKANKNKSFQGSVVVGMGFVLEPDEAESLIERDERNRDVIFPYLNGQDLNSSPDQSPSRWVINFFDWPRERTLPGRWDDLTEKEQKKHAREGIVPEDYPGPVAADYPEVFQIAKERVFPFRQGVNRAAHKKYWWHYGDKRPALYETIAPLKRVLVCSRVSKYLSFAFVPVDWVYSEATVVVASDSPAVFAALSSDLHDAWARIYTSSLETRLRYGPTDAFENFPFPNLLTANSQQLTATGQSYHEHRRQLMLDRQEGLTATYNRFHDPDERADDIERLRQLHVEMDNAVAAAYGWSDLVLGHDFHETPQGIRYTLHDDARREVLTRLLALNHERYAEEVAAGLHDKKKGTSRKKRGSKKPRKSQVDKGQLSMFE